MISRLLILVPIMLCHPIHGVAYGKKTIKENRGYSTPFGKAGCGLGSVIISEKTKNAQIAASLINTYIGFVSSAITSGTSNCDYSNQTAQMEQAVFISANLSSLEKEAVQGQGSHLDALAELFGCETDADRGVFYRFNKSRYSLIYNEPTPELVYKKMKQVGQSDGKIVSACPGIS